VAATGFDAAPPSIVVDNAATNPFFVNEAAGDYNLLSTSPAQSAGAALPTDIAAALAVPVSPVDMGLCAFNIYFQSPHWGIQIILTKWVAFFQK
jgi:hypothetical protein